MQLSRRWWCVRTQKTRDVHVCVRTLQVHVRGVARPLQDATSGLENQGHLRRTPGLYGLHHRRHGRVSQVSTRTLEQGAGLATRTDTRMRLSRWALTASFFSRCQRHF